MIYMKFLLLIILVQYSFSENNECSSSINLTEPIIIANYLYTVFKDQSWFQLAEKLNEEYEGIKIFPFFNGYPTFKSSSCQYIQNREEVKSQSNKILRDYYLNPVDFTNMLFQIYYKVKYWIFWNKEVTYLYLDIPKGNQFKFKLGRGLYEEFDLTKDEEKKIWVFDITTAEVQQLSCITEDSTGNKLQINNKKVFSNFGGKSLYVRACQGVISSSITFKKDFTNEFTVNMIEDGNKYKGMTPFIWYPGTYKTSIQIGQTKYKSSIIVGSITETDRIEIKEYNIISEAKEALHKITLAAQFNTENPNVTLHILLFNKNVLDFLLESKPEIVDSITVNCLGNSTICVISSSLIMPGIKLDPTKHMGLFVAEGKNGRIFSKIFNLIWLVKHKMQFSQYSICDNFIKQKAPSNPAKCPSSNLLAQVIPTEFQSAKSQNWNDNLDCYESVRADSEKLFVTCCYSRENNNLIYGQSFYISNMSRIDGTYRWKYHPEYQPHQHFLFDRLPLISCCLLIEPENNDTCHTFWSKFHNISMSKWTANARADLFGDPHVFQFNNNEPFSYLQSGFYSLMRSNKMMFLIRGLFYCGFLRIPSLLQMLIIDINLNTINNQHMEILPVKNKMGTLSWTIKIDKEDIVLFPYANKYFFITQKEGTENLMIYILLSQGFTILMELSRYETFHAPLVYLNLVVWLSTSNQNKLNDIDGIFGNPVRNNTFPENGINNYFQHWKTDLEKSDLILNEGLEQLNKIYSFDYKPLQNKSECENNNLCNRDVSELKYSQEIGLQTLAADKNRMKYKKLLNRTLFLPDYCSYPNNNDWIINSADFSENSKISIVGCLDANKTLKYDNVFLTCVTDLKTGQLRWDLSVSDWSSVCFNLKEPPTSKSNIVGATVGGIFAGLILLAIVIALIFLIFHIKKRKSQVNTEASVASNTQKVNPKSVYDEIELEAVYNVYASISKS